MAFLVRLGEAGANVCLHERVSYHAPPALVRRRADSVPVVCVAQGTSLSEQLLSRSAARGHRASTPEREQQEGSSYQANDSGNDIADIPTLRRTRAQRPTADSPGRSETASGNTSAGAMPCPSSNRSRRPLRVCRAEVRQASGRWRGNIHRHDEPHRLRAEPHRAREVDGGLVVVEAIDELELVRQPRNGRRDRAS